MKRSHSSTIKGVEELLVTRGYSDSKVELIKKKGRNNVVLKDVANDLFIKIYTDSETLINSIEAQKIIEKTVHVPNLIYYSEKKLGEFGYVSIWNLIKDTRISKYVNPSNSDLKEISTAIIKIHKTVDSTLFGPHFPIKQSGSSWDDYLVKWVIKSIEMSTREIEEYKKTKVISHISTYLNVHKKKLQAVENTLLQGDIDISNFLFSKNRQMVVTDLDYSIYGDPAWEFASAMANWKFSAPCYKDMLEIYLKGRNFNEKQRKDFRSRVKFYGPIKKAVLIYSIKDISSLSAGEEMDLCFRELNNIPYI